VGTALAARLSRAGVPVAGIHARRAEQAASAGAYAGVLGTSGDYPEILGESDVVILAVSDDAIGEVAAALVAQGQLGAHQVLLHCSGALAADAALAAATGRVAGRGTMHPLVSFADVRLAAAGLRGAAFAVEGDELGRRRARQLAELLGGVPVEIDASRMAFYHAAAVIACNYVVTLLDAGRELLVHAGFGDAEAVAALVPLVSGTLRNVAEVSVPQALTGPIARGDAGTVARHVAALAAEAPELLPLYRAVGERTVALAARRADAPPAAALAAARAALAADGAAPPPRPRSAKPAPRARSTRATASTRATKDGPKPKRRR
jgi:predicted short-subunit dehydrogenase-like oxidoreductase (DUF2520 family)